jgi:bile acid-coenzyme A ligase
LLERQGVDATSLVAVGLRNSPEHFFVSIGAWKLGACVLPLRWDMPPRERDALLDVAAPTLVVGDWDEVAFALLRSHELSAADDLSSDPLPDRLPSPAMAIASGGSTGRPKIIITPGNGLAPGSDPGEPPPPMNKGVGDYIQTRRGQTQLIASPLYHAAGFRGSFHALTHDQPVVVMERFTAERAIDLIERYRVNVVNMVPTMLMRIARLPDIDRRDLSSLDSVMASAASSPAWLVHTWCRLVKPEHFFISYGASEYTGMALVRGDEWLQHPGTVGRGMGTDIRILGEDGRELATGAIGEIYMRPVTDIGPTYEYRGAAPASTTADGFVSVGDLGWLDEDGYLYIADRRADMIVTGGANVYPAEVEAVLSEHPGVSDVAVIGLPDEEWGQRVVALVQPTDPSSPVPAEELDCFCRERLSTYKAPKSYDFVDRLPRSEAGKLNRSALIAERAPANRAATDRSPG